VEGSILSFSANSARIFLRAQRSKAFVLAGSGGVREDNQITPLAID
jgi:hypothetical protein